MKFINKFFKLYILFLLFYALINFYECKTELVFYFIEILIILIFTSIKRLQQSIIPYFLSLYYGMIGIIQPIDTLKHPLYFIDFRINQSLLLNFEIRKYYFLFLGISYSLLMISMLIVYSFFSKKVISIGNNDNCTMINRKRTNALRIFFIAFTFSFGRYVFQNQFSILSSGNAASIEHAGFFVFAIRILFLIVWSFCVSAFVDSKDGLILKTVKVSLLALICGVPQALMGSRSEIFFLLIQGFVLIVLLNQNDLKKHLFKLIFAIGIVLVVSVVSILVSNKLRNGNTMGIIDFLSMRVTGVTDGLVVISYLRNGGDYLGLDNLLKSIFGSGNGLSIASFYTYDVVGYYRNVIHAYALPNFAACSLCGGVWSLIIISIIEGAFLGICESIIRRLSQKNSTRHTRYLVCLVYVLVMFIMTSLFEGNIDRFTQFLMIGVAAAIFFKFFTKGRLKTRSVDVWELKRR